MRTLLLATSLIVTLAAGAEARPASSSMTCAAARALVAKQGAIVMDTSPTTFDRFVVDAGFCALGTVTRPAWVQTRDQPQCMIGYTCETPLPRPGLRF
jgi:hypothetical protein